METEKLTAEAFGQLQDELKQAQTRIKELREELAQAKQLADKLTEQVQNSNDLIDGWIESFEMVLNESGQWTFAPFVDAYADLHQRHEDLARRWNKFVLQFNATVRKQDIGRPLHASEAQQRDVLKLRKGGASLRAIAKQTSLGLRTVRTIIDQDKGADRTTKRRGALRKHELDRQRMASWRARKRSRDGLPKRITETRKNGERLLKAAKLHHMV